MKKTLWIGVALFVTALGFVNDVVAGGNAVPVPLFPEVKSSVPSYDKKKCDSWVDGRRCGGKRSKLYAVPNTDSDNTHTDNERRVVTFATLKANAKNAPGAKWTKLYM